MGNVLKKLKKYQQDILTWLHKDSLTFFNQHINTVLFSFILIIIFLFIENFVTTKSAEYFEGYSTLSGNFLFIILVIATFFIACYLFRRKNIFLPIDFLLIFIYFKYRCSPGSAYQVDKVDLDLWAIFNKPFHFLYIDLALLFYGWVLYNIYRNFRNRNKPIKYEMGYFYPDLSLGELTKLNGTSLILEDKYSREPFAKEIVASIEKIKPFTAFSIGISGKWGSGKTSLFHLIKEKLDNNDTIKVIEFSPWYSSKPEALIKDFFRVLENYFQGDLILLENLKSYATGIATIEKNYFSTEFFKNIFENKENIKEKYKKIAEILRRQEKLFVIMIDDLDRLDKKEIISVLKLIRIIADFPNIVYLAAYDREHIDSAIKRELIEDEQNQYVDKIFTMEFTIPEPSPDEIVNQLKIHLLEKLKSIGVDINDNELSLFLEKKNPEHYIRNPRDVKRFTNNFIFSYKSIKDYSINLKTFLLLQLINYKYSKVYKKIYDNEEKIFSYIQQMKKKNGTVAKVDVSLIIEENGENANIIDYVFNDKCQYSISIRSNFRKYFSLTLFAEEIKYEEVDDSINTLEIDALLSKIEEYFEKNNRRLIAILYDMFVAKTSKSYEKLELYLKILHLIYLKYLQMLTTNVIDEQKEVYNSNLVHVSETVWNLLSNVDLNKKYDSFYKIFGTEKEKISIVIDILKAKDGDNFKEYIPEVI